MFKVSLFSLRDESMRFSSVALYEVEAIGGISIAVLKVVQTRRKIDADYNRRVAVEGKSGCKKGVLSVLRKERCCSEAKQTRNNRKTKKIIHYSGN